MNTFIYLTKECLILDRVYGKGQIVEISSAERAKNLANNGVGILLSDAKNHKDNQEFLTSAIKYLEGKGTPESTAFANDLKKFIPELEPKKIPKRKSKGDL